MIDTHKLKGKMAEHDITQRALAKELNMTEKTFRFKLKNNTFGTDDVSKISKLLCLNREELLGIFFPSW